MPYKCIYDGCDKQPIFNLSHETKGLYCSEHKKEGMIDVKHNKCTYNGCNNRANYNLITYLYEKSLYSIAV